VWDLRGAVGNHTAFNLESAGEMLRTVTRLIAQLETLPVPREVAGTIAEGARHLAAARAALAAGDRAGAARHSQAARRAAESAAFHPSMLSDLHIPKEHVLSMYIPYCVPISVTVLSLFVKSVRRWRAERAGEAGSGASEPAS